MATDLQKIWFLSIRTADSFELNRLLFTTPSPAAGTERLTWTLPPEIGVDLPDKYHKYLGVSTVDMNGLEYAVVNWILHKQTPARFDIIKTLLSVTPTFMLSHKWGKLNTVMHLAAVCGDEKIFKLLSNKGGKRDLENGLGFTADHLLSTCRPNSHLDEQILSVSGPNQTDAEEQQMIEKLSIAGSKPQSPVKPSLMRSQPQSPEKQLKNDSHDITGGKPPLSNVERIKLQLRHKQRKTSFGTMSTGKITKPAAVEEISPMAIMAAKEIKNARLTSSSRDSSPVRFPRVTFDDILNLDENESESIAKKIMAEVAKSNESSPIKVSAKTCDSFSKPSMPALKHESTDEKKEKSVLAVEQNSIEEKKEIPLPGVEQNTTKEEKATSLPAVEATIIPENNSEKNFTPPPVIKDFASEIIKTFKPVGVAVESTAYIAEAHLSVEKPDAKAETEPPTTVKSVDLAMIYDETTTKPFVSVSNEPGKRSPSPKKVQFGNSWKGNMENKRSAVTEHDYTSLKSTPYGKLFLKVTGIQGLIMDLSKLPSNASLYFAIKTNPMAEPVYTKPIPCCPQIMHTIVPMKEEFSFFTSNPEDVFTIEMRVRMELQRHRKFSAKQILRSGSIRDLLRGRKISSRSNPQPEPPSVVHEEIISKIQIRLADILDRCKDQILQRKWSWEVIETATNNNDNQYERPSSRISRLSRSSSRIIEAGSVILSKLKNNNPSSLISRGHSLCEISEAGTLDMQMYYVPNLDSEQESCNVPSHIDEALKWVVRKNWYGTSWTSGFLSQQGGDVFSWRRRFYKLVGSQMDAYHEFKMDYRTSIDLSQAVDIKSMSDLDADLYPSKFSFRINFKHDEFIEFYADNEEDYDKWTAMLTQVIQNMPKVDEQSIMKAIKTESPKKEEIEQPVFRKPALKSNIYEEKLDFSSLDKSHLDYYEAVMERNISTIEEESLDIKHSAVENTDSFHKKFLHGIPEYGKAVPRKAPAQKHVGVFGSGTY